jgi:IS5 family transposase
MNDLLSFMRFLGLNLSDRFPTRAPIWLFPEKLTKAEAIKPLFERFDAALREAGYIAMDGQIVDASLIAAAKPRMTEQEKAAIKDGRVPEDWKASRPSSGHKDRDAWASPTRTCAGRGSRASPRRKCSKSSSVRPQRRASV